MGFHICGACRGSDQPRRFPNTSSGDVNLGFTNGHRWVMPDMILHYVEDHGWQPPADFVADVMGGALEAGRRIQTRGVGSLFDNATRVGYLEGTIPTGPVPAGFVERLESLMQQASGAGMRAQTKGVALRGKAEANLCPWCGGPGPSSTADTAYCSKECASIAATEGWSSDGKTPEEQLVAKGNAAPIEDVLKYFDRHGNLGGFARKEMPQVCKALGIKTIGDLIQHTREQIAGPQCHYAGNKTLEWVTMVLQQFDKRLPVPLEADEIAYIASHGLEQF